MKIWLADLTYTQQSIASDVVPAGIGMIAEYTEKKIPNIEKIKLYKFPEILSGDFEKNRPDVIGFSNYLWNSSLSDAFAKQIKKIYPEIITVMGGPNFPTDTTEQKKYVEERPWLDFYIVKEGEHAFVKLIEFLMKKSISDIKTVDDVIDLPNLVFLKDRLFHSSKKIERIMDLSEIPSPYLSNRLDEFLDGKLLPITQTNRGCPFTCTFCTEGQSYWTKVRRKPRDVVENEVSYIADKMNTLPAEKRRTDLLIADSNFGMFTEDLDTCKVIADEQKKNGYPKYINVATGKNKKERVLEAAKIVNGAMKLAGSVQSLDPEIQDNIKRKNISSKEIVDMALKSSEIGANTYSEVILGLPGDTKEKHFKTLKTLVESSFTTISMYQLMILPGTELGSRESINKYEMDIKYRVVPRCYGTYKFLGDEISVSEVEGICTSTNTLSFQDYLDCRKINLIINIFYNDSVFEEVISLLNKLKISIWDWLEEIYINSSKEEFKDFKNLLNDFLDDSEKELWKDKEKLTKFTSNKENINLFIEGKLGSNLIFKYKSRSLTYDLDVAGKIAEYSTNSILSKMKIQNPSLKTFIKELVLFKKCQIEDIFDLELIKEGKFNFDINKYIQDKNENFISINLNKYKFRNIKKIKFYLTKEQINQIKSYNLLFGNKIDGISRTLSRVYIKKLFRTLNNSYQITNDEFHENNSRRWGGGLESV
tara:strand:+ start:786 stop:2906 length:2121 start_codon:yes stop_codon:yes gene_type:complete